MFTITKTFKFEAAHRLVNGYEGKCAHIHGHSWVVRVTVMSGVLDKFGFVQDFGALKPIKEWIDEVLDHAMLINANDEQMRDFLHSNGQRYFQVAGNPTSERLAVVIFNKARDLGFAPHSVSVDETCTSSCTYREY